MGPVPKFKDVPQPQYPEPAHADYSDEVTERDLHALADMVKSELEGDEWEIVDGPGW